LIDGEHQDAIGTGKSRREMWVDDEGERRVGGFFIDREEFYER